MPAFAGAAYFSGTAAAGHGRKASGRRRHVSAGTKAGFAGKPGAGPPALHALTPRTRRSLPSTAGGPRCILAWSPHLVAVEAARRPPPEFGTGAARGKRAGRFRPTSRPANCCGRAARSCRAAAAEACHRPGGLGHPTIRIAASFLGHPVRPPWRAPTGLLGAAPLAGLPRVVGFSRRLYPDHGEDSRPTHRSPDLSLLVSGSFDLEGNRRLGWLASA